MRIIDAQQHEPSVWLGWEGLARRQDDDRLREADEDLFIELVLAGMTAVGVSAAVLFPAARNWAQRASQSMPAVFRTVLTVDRPFLAERTPREIAQFVATQRARPAVVGARIVLPVPSSRVQRPGHPPAPAEEQAVHDLREGVAFLEAGGYDDFFRACEREGMPLFVWAPTRSDVVGQIADRHPGIQLVVDHLGLSVPSLAEPDDPPFRYLPDLLKIAEFDNVAVKLYNLPAFSKKGYPFTDVHEQLAAIVDAFGPERVMWASNISGHLGRIGAIGNPYAEGRYPGKHNYSQSLHFIRDSEILTPEEKEWILGRSVEKILGWPAPETVENGDEGR